MAQRVILVIIGFACMASCLGYVLSLYRSNLWRWTDEGGGVHVYSGYHPPNATRVNPNPLWYAGCIAGSLLGLLLVFNEISPWHKWSGRVFAVYGIALVGVVTTGAGLYMIVRGALAWRNQHSTAEATAEATAEEPAQMGNRDVEEEYVMEVNLDPHERAQEQITNSLLDWLPPYLRMIASGSVLLAVGVPALDQLPGVVARGSSSLDEKLMKTVPLLVLLLIFLLIIIFIAASVIWLFEVNRDAAVAR